jgi:hypothetical protein
MVSVQKVYEITIPGLSMQTDFPAVRHRLLADFPQVTDVIATTTPATVQILYTGEAAVDAWIAALSESVAARRMSRGHTTFDARRERFTVS